MLSQQCIQTVHLSKFFSLNKGVLQGDILVPFLFIIVVDYILQQVHDSHAFKRRAENAEENLPVLDFADNTVHLDETDIPVAEHYHNIQINASQVGLGINNDINYHRQGSPSELLKDSKNFRRF